MAASTSLHSTKIGFIGGGQMTLMLAQRAREMGYHVSVLSSEKDDPAVAAAHVWVKGSIFNEIDIKNLAAKVDVITFESEFIPARTLKKAIEKTTAQIYPNLDSLAILQDRWPQKELLWDLNIPTAEFIKITGKDDLEAAFKVFDSEMVLKKRLGGHDGFGTFIIKTKSEFDFFKRNHRNAETQFIAEKYIHFKSEKTLIFCRNAQNDLFIYPLLNCQSKNQQCFRVSGPDLHKNQDELIVKITAMLEKINYIGIIAFELFDVGNNLLVNEVVPRVHNAGHITQDAFSIDQFELHLRSILGLNFPLEVQSTQKFLMQNILGKSQRKPRIEAGLQGKLHWYNKKTNRPHKKLGHINYFGNSLKNLTTLADYDLRKIKT